MEQKDVFAKSEADSYFTRNRSKLAAMEASLADDPILRMVATMGLAPRHVLEVGCANGWRLEALRQTYGSKGSGIEPSALAVTEGRQSYPELQLFEGTADVLPLEPESVDMVVFGFCLYLCDRRDLFKIAYEADRVLQNRGYAVILDFSPPFAYRNAYSHHAGLYSFKMDYAQMLLWNPQYFECSRTTYSMRADGSLLEPNDRYSVVVLQKNIDHAYPVEPFRA